MKREKLRRELVSRPTDGWPEYDGDPVGYVRGELTTADSLDFKNPDYEPVYAQRDARLKRLRSDPRLLALLKTFYANDPVAFIMDWGTTFDPRVSFDSVTDTPVDEKLLRSVMVPFILFKRQAEWCEYTLARWRAGRRGLTEKSRESGVSWLAISLSNALCLFRRGLVIGFGSNKQMNVDTKGSPASLFEKARMQLEAIPVEFLDGWNRNRHASLMRIQFPGTSSMLVGDAGDNIGRGARCTLYFVDEAAHLEHPGLIEASLMSTARCRMDISTPRGLGNPFEQNARSGRIEKFTFHWRDDPRKDDAWYEQQKAEAISPAVIAQELDIDYAASVEGVLIPNAWVLAALDAHTKLGVTPSGRRWGGLDVADEGYDLNAFCGGHGILIEVAEEWSGESSDIFGTVERAFRYADQYELAEFRYDADGLGAGVRGDARVINERRLINRERQVTIVPFRGSGAVMDPEKEDVKGRKNQDFFANRKAQAWWSLRTRFLNTYRAVAEGCDFDPDQIISISAQLPNRMKLISELSQPTYTSNAVGKIVIDKAPEGTRSPNLADALMIREAKARATVSVSQEDVRRAALPAGAIMPPAAAPAKRPPGITGVFVTPDILQRARLR